MRMCARALVGRRKPEGVDRGDAPLAQGLPRQARGRGERGHRYRRRREGYEGRGGGRRVEHVRGVRARVGDVADVEEERVACARVVRAPDVEQQARAVRDAKREREADGDLVQAELRKSAR